MNQSVKIIFGVAGTLCLLLGVAGAVLPLLPATPFLLLASACYARSSERLHRRLVRSRHLGAYIAAFRGGKGLPVRAKVYALLLLWASLLASAYRLDSSLLALVLFAVGASVTALLLSLRTLKAGRGCPE